MFRSAALLVALPLAAQPKPDAQLQHFTGRVHTVITYAQQPDFEHPGQLREPVRVSEQTFDEQGWEIGGAQFDMDGQEMMRYDTRRRGSCILESTTVRRFPPEAAERTVALGTENCRPKGTSRYKLDGTLIERVVVDYEGDTIRESHYDSNDKLTQQRTFKSFDSPGPAPGQFNAYEKGKLVSSTEISGTPEKFETHTRTYGSDGKLQEDSIRNKTDKGYSGASVNADGTSSAAVQSPRSFDTLMTINGDKIRTHMERDQKGREVEIDTFNNDKLRSKVSITYEEDEHGNWTKRTMEQLAEGQPENTTIQLRTITYY